MTAYPGAISHPGPASKVWPDVNTREGVIEHSLEGGLAAGLAQLDGAVEVSWHYTVAKDGRVYEHYPLTASCWHAGSHAQNARLIGVEHEGVAGEPLTIAQRDASVKLTRWIAAQCGFPLTRHDHLLEHNEVFATACPSGRIPWGYYVPENDPNHQDGYDTGLTRINAEAAVEAIAKVHKQAEGDAFYLIQIVNRVFGVNYHL